MSDNARTSVERLHLPVQWLWPIAAVCALAGSIYAVFATHQQDVSAENTRRIEQLESNHSGLESRLRAMEIELGKFGVRLDSMDGHMEDMVSGQKVILDRLSPRE